MSWYFEVLKKYAVFGGRARRKEYWMFALMNVIVAFVIGIVDGLLGFTTAVGLGILSIIYMLAILAGREALVPRWLIGIPVMSAAITGGSLIAQAAGADIAWWVLISGMFMSVIWLIIAGLWLLFTPSEGRVPAPTGRAAAM